LNQSIAINPSFYPPYDAKHDCLDKQGKFEDCLNNLNEALRFISDQDCTNKIQCFRGETFNKLERYEEALTVCDLVIRNDDLYGDAYIVKTEALRMLNRLHEAEECYEMAFSGDCNFTNSNTKIYFVPT
jgi:tetratricopeptide (TPR) repeat protein